MEDDELYVRMITHPVYSERVQYSKAMIDEFDLDQDGEINERCITCF